MDTDWYLQIVEVSHLDNAFYTLGGSGWDGEPEARKEYDAIATIPWVSGATDPEYSLDLLDSDMSIIDNKAISRETAEVLLGGDFEELRRKAREEVADMEAALARI